MTGRHLGRVRASAPQARDPSCDGQAVRRTRGRPFLIGAQELEHGVVTLKPLDRRRPDSRFRALRPSGASKTLLADEPMIAVVDYGAGNIHSVARALNRVGATFAVTNDADRGGGWPMPSSYPALVPRRTPCGGCVRRACR